MIDLVIVAVYLVAILAVGLYTSRNTKTMAEYAVVRRSYGAVVIFATMSASAMGGGYSMGNAEKVFLFGIANIAGLWAVGVQQIFVASVIAPRMDRFANAISVGDIMATSYGTTGRIVSGVFAVVVCAGVVGAQVSAIGLVFNAFLGLDLTAGILLGCGFVILYTTVGGMRAVVVTDLFQFVVLAIGIPTVLIFGIVHVGGVAEVLAEIPDAHLTLPGSQDTWLGLAALCLTFFLGEILVPPYLQRLLIARSARHAARGTLFAGLFAIPFTAVTGMIGLVTLALDPAVSSNLALPYLVVTVLPPVLMGLVVSGIIAVVMSSADSYLNSASIAFVNDIVRPLGDGNMSPRAHLVLARLVTLTVGLLAIVFALTIESLIDILFVAYTYWAPVVVVPLVATVMGYPKSMRNFVAGAVVGFATAMTWNEVLDMPFLIEGLVVGTLANLLVFVLIPAAPQTNAAPGRPDAA